MLTVFSVLLTIIFANSYVYVMSYLDKQKNIAQLNKQIPEKSHYFLKAYGVWLLMYALLIGIGCALEWYTTSKIEPKFWEWYAITFLFYIVCSFPGWLYLSKK